MMGLEAFLILDGAGLSIKANGDRLGLAPATLVTVELDALATKHKHELLALARDAEQHANHVVLAAMSSSARRSNCPTARVERLRQGDT